MTTIAQRHKMKMDRRVKWVTTIVLVLVSAIFTFFYFTSSGSYLPGWFTILITAMLLLASLSIPRFISVTQTSLEIHCIVELTVIPLTNIKRIEVIARKDMKWAMPIPFLGIWGIFGYYGYYFDFKNLKTFKLYASEWDNFIVIENVYEEVTVISCSDPEQMVNLIRNQK